MFINVVDLVLFTVHSYYKKELICRAILWSMKNNNTLDVGFSEIKVSTNKIALTLK